MNANYTNQTGKTTVLEALDSEKLLKLDAINKYPNDEDLLEDFIIENKL